MWILPPSLWICFFFLFLFFFVVPELNLPVIFFWGGIRSSGGATGQGGSVGSWRFLPFETRNFNRKVSALGVGLTSINAPATIQVTRSISHVRPPPSIDEFQTRETHTIIAWRIVLRDTSKRHHIRVYLAYTNKYHY